MSGDLVAAAPAAHPLFWRALRVTGASLAGGLVGGAVGGLGARLAMLVMRLLAPQWRGVTTHGGAPVGTVTLDGTLSLVIEGALFYGLAGGVLYLLVRAWLPVRTPTRILAFGSVVLAVGAPGVLDGGYEYFRYGHVGVAVLLFASLLPLSAAVIVPVSERLAGGERARPSNVLVRRGGAAVLAAVTLLGLARLAVLLRDVYRLW